MMATIGPEYPLAPSPMHAMDDPSASNMRALGHRHARSVPRCTTDERPPNSSFSFPALPDPEITPVVPRTSSDRPVSTTEDLPEGFSFPGEEETRIDGPAPLPAFSFNPGASLPADPPANSFLSPHMSPNNPRQGASTQRPAGHGHRRGGSEFVGGRIREGNSIAVFSTSPTKPESGFASPNFQPPRRGHRRGLSSAISTNDLPILIPPDLSESKGGSAPTSPTNFDETVMPLSLPEDTPKLPETEDELAPPASPSEMSPKPEAEPLQQPTKPPTRARVGFSDKLEFIPRPLSLISSDTSSTITTIRPGHTLSDSISSFMAPQQDSPTVLSRSSTRGTDSRPSTAGAILERSKSPELVQFPERSPKRRNSIPTLLNLANSEVSTPPLPSPSKSKRWTFFGLDPFSGSPTKARPSSASSSDSALEPAWCSSNLEHGFESPGEKSESDGKSKKTRPNKRKIKVKDWAGAILYGKPKSQNKCSKAVRPPTPPASTAVLDDEDDEEAFVVAPTIMPPTLVIEESIPLPETKRAEEVMSPMIDLDAALGPFNTPLPHNPEWEAAQQAARLHGKRHLHSAQGMRGFSGPGMHYHRRAESAPDLPPFEGGRSAVHRYGSSSTMADVFEEDEEDSGEASHDRPDTKDESSASSDVSEDNETPPAAPNSLLGPPLLDAGFHLIRRKSSGLSDKDESAARSIRTERSKTSLHEQVIEEEATPNIIFRSPNAFQMRRSSNESGGPLPRKSYGNLDISPMEFKALHHPNGAVMPVSPYAASQSSSYPSPRTPLSLDAQRISTAPSSINEENSFQSLLMGEPGPEVRLSIDYDVPSLTSSTSATTRESCFIPPQRMSQPSLRELPRPVSVSSAAFGRRRSSLVSLSRLISSSHGERSKLSMEVTLDDNEAKRSRHSKTKRLGRMMQFWKPSKDSNPAGG